MDALRNDLEGARELGVGVQLELTTGESFLTGLHHWEDNEGWFSVYVQGQSLRDFDTRKVMRHQVSTWTVTEIKYAGYDSF